MSYFSFLGLSGLDSCNSFSSTFKTLLSLSLAVSYLLAIAFLISTTTFLISLSFTFFWSIWMVLFSKLYFHTIFYFCKHIKHSYFIILVPLTIAGLFQEFSVFSEKGASFLFYLVNYFLSWVYVLYNPFHGSPLRSGLMTYSFKKDLCLRQASTWNTIKNQGPL